MHEGPLTRSVVGFYLLEKKQLRIKTLQIRETTSNRIKQYRDHPELSGSNDSLG